VITLNVVAVDKSGKPVSGLQQQDFTLFDNKLPKKILSFEAKTGREAGDITLVMDEVNTSFSRVAYEREQVKKFLQRDGGRLTQPVALAFLSDKGLEMQQSSSVDGNALAAELDQNKNALRTIRNSEGFYGAADRSQLSFRALNQLIEVEAKKPGRKTIIWISPGWPLLSGPRMDLTSKQQHEIFNNIVATSTQLRDSQITLYNVDPLGTEEGLGRENYYQQFLKGVRKYSDAQYGDLGLQVIAFQSGGRVLNASNDLPGEVEKCVQDLNAYYVLSFEGAPGDGPDEYHAIEVRIGQPGVKAQTRSGYYARP
jgi:VWFA-related protein